MTASSHAPILVSGAHRSGTTWVGRLLGMSREITYLHEPFSNEHPGWAGGRLPRQFQYICEENEAAFRPITDRMMALRYPAWEQLPRLRRARSIGRLGIDWALSVWGRLRQLRPLLKDPLAVFSAPWLAHTYGMRVVMIVRHPAGFASSLKRLHWTFDFQQLADQPLLLRHVLPRYADQIRAYAAQPPDIIEQAILLWNIIYDAVDQFRAQHPDWLIVQHDVLARAPLEGFQRLYTALGLRWDAQVAAQVTAYSSPDNVKEVAADRPATIKRDSAATAVTWRTRLSPDDIARVEAGTREVEAKFRAEAGGAAATEPAGSAVGR